MRNERRYGKRQRNKEFHGKYKQVLHAGMNLLEESEAGMREILFRGKTLEKYGIVNKGEWRFGSLLFNNNESGTICKIMGSCLTDNKGGSAMAIAYDVDPDTICQYTGLTDREGKKIFEGDILEIETENVTKEDGCFAIEWSEPGSCFVLCGKRCLAHFDRVYEDCREVIGNIFDNPELIGG